MAWNIRLLLDNRESKGIPPPKKNPTSTSLTMQNPLTVWITENWKILKEMGIPDHLTYLLRNLYASQETVVRIGHRAMDWVQTGKGVCQGCILSFCLFNLYGEYIMRSVRLMSYKLESRLPGEISTTSEIQMILL